MTSNEPSFPIGGRQPREAVPADVPGILGLIRELAVYEREPDAVKTTEADLHAALFGERPTVFAHVIDDVAPSGTDTGTPERTDDVGTPASAGTSPGGAATPLAGMALWFLNFSTWEGVNGIYLEDLYVTPDRRGAGLGTLLLKRLAETCVERGYARLEWSVLNWNEPSIGFYTSLGARPQSDWSTFRLTGAPLRSLGSA